MRWMQWWGEIGTHAHMSSVSFPQEGKVPGSSMMDQMAWAKRFIIFVFIVQACWGGHRDNREERTAHGTAGGPWHNHNAIFILLWPVWWSLAALRIHSGPRDIPVPHNNNSQQQAARRSEGKRVYKGELQRWGPGTGRLWVPLLSSSALSERCAAAGALRLWRAMCIIIIIMTSIW